MQLLDMEPAQLWRLLIPRQQWLFVDDVPIDRLVFQYRDRVYIVTEEGSVLSVPQPAGLTYMQVDEFFNHLAESADTYDFDDQGIFDYGSILLAMGYVVPVGRKGRERDYCIEIINTVDHKQTAVRYVLTGVDFPFALYHGLIRCHQLNAAADWETEYAVVQISEHMHQADICFS